MHFYLQLISNFIWIRPKLKLIVHVCVCVGGCGWVWVGGCMCVYLFVCMCVCMLLARPWDLQGHKHHWVYLFRWRKLIMHTPNLYIPRVRAHSNTLEPPPVRLLFVCNCYLFASILWSVWPNFLNKHTCPLSPSKTVKE